MNKMIYVNLIIFLQYERTFICLLIDASIVIS